MGKDLFDASIGLAFSLAAFEKYQKSGLLQADLHHVPGMRGRCKGCLEIVRGKAAFCYIEDGGGQHHPMQVSKLIQLDNERGPFAWTLTDDPSPTTRIGASLHHTLHPPTPRIVALLDLDELQGWTPTHKRILLQVYQTINGRRNLEDIKQALPLPSHMTEEALHVLSTLHVITLAESGPENPAPLSRE